MIRKGAKRLSENVMSEQPPSCLLHAPDLAREPPRRSHPASVASTIEVGAAIKSP